VAIEMAPFDVEYGGFTACNINAVTRSGSNEWTGRAWIDYNDDSLSGDELEGTSINRGSFDETRYGFSLGGPIIKDKLFFFLGYEYAETADTFSQCAGDQSCGSPVTGTTQAQIDRIRSIAETLYQFDPGDDISTLPNEDEKYLIRVDWNVTENHSAALVYNFNDGFNFTRSDDDDNEYEFSNHWYERGAEFEAWTGHLFSDWTDALSTEVRVGFSTLDQRQQTRDPSGFGEAQIETYDADGNQGLVYLGTDDSRQSNKLDYETTNLKFAANYALGDHYITAGYEYEEIDIFNLFVQHSIGEYRFDEMCGATNPDGCIDAFEDFSPDDIYYGNNVSLDPADSAAKFAYAVNTLYLQDEFTFDSLDLTIIAGLRYDWYTSDDLPVENPNFIDRTGFSNRQNFDGESLLQPRLGFQWNVNDSLSVHGGAGLFSGGNPNVWLGNNYQNDGFTQIQARESDDGLSDLNTDPTRNLTTEPLGQDGNGQPLYDAPQVMFDYVANSTANSSVNAVDPNFDLPQAWKFSLGAVYEFDVFSWNPFTVQGDFIYSIAENSALIVDDTYVQIGDTHDGRPVYFPTDKSVPGCAADPLSDPAACGRLFTNDHILTNVDGDDAEQLSLSFVLSQAYDFGLDWSLGYAFTDSDDVNPMTSSVAFSNYFNVAVADPNDPGLSRSNYEIPHRFVLRFGFEKAFFGDYYTRFNLVASRNKGRPYSYTMDQDFLVRGPFFNADDDRSLLYVPDGPSDPNVIYDASFNQQAFFDYLQSTGLNKYAGGIAPRNAFYSPWWTKADLRISQDIPSFAEGHFAQAFIVVENLTNLLNDDWGVFYETGFPRTRAIVDATLVDTAGTPDVFSDDVYSYNSFSSLNSSRVTSPSLWAVRIGLSYNF
jgi:hypothetical protein